MMRNRPAKVLGGFTLIELLIVVAIIAILAAIAVPNFLEAQTRSKVSRELADLRTQAVALESYFVDHNCYTRDSDSSLDGKDVGSEIAWDSSHPDFSRCANGALQLTTPVAYMTSILNDPFVTKVEVEGQGAMGYRIGSGTWSYGAAGDSLINTKDHQNSDQIFKVVGKKGAFVLIGVGPDGARARIGYKCFPFQPKMPGAEGPADDPIAIVKGGQPGCYTDYDPTNGTTSVGDVYKFGGSWRDGRFCYNGVTVGAGDSPDGGSLIW